MDSETAARGKYVRRISAFNPTNSLWNFFAQLFREDRATALPFASAVCRRRLLPFQKKIQCPPNTPFLFQKQIIDNCFFQKMSAILNSLNVRIATFLIKAHIFLSHFVCSFQLPLKLALHSAFLRPKLKRIWWTSAFICMASQISRSRMRSIHCETSNPS